MKTPPDEIRRIVFLGTPAIAVPPLYALHEAGFEIAHVVTNRDKRRGRGGDLAPTPVKRAAQRLGVPVSHRVDDVLDAGADLGVVVAFGRLIKAHVLDELPMVNIHYSLLPRWRGAAPLERALLAGDTETGVCLMELAYGLDTGDVYDRVVVPIGERATLESVRDDLVSASNEMLIRNLTNGLPTPVPQDGEVTWADKLDPAEFELDFTRPAVELDRVVRVGRAHTFVRGKRLVVHETAVIASPERMLEPGQIADTAVGTGEGHLQLVRVQPEGRAVMDADAWANGARLTDDDRLGR